MNDEFSRQSFLGPNAQDKIERNIIGLVGLSGGGSHFAQQLTHVGFLHYVLYDPERIELPNLHRHVGAVFADIGRNEAKLAIAQRVICSVRPNAVIEAFGCRWQDHPEPLKRCDVLIGATDGMQERHELEVLSRRYMIPYLDIGMDVRQMSGQPPRMAGQVFLSMPGDRCMWCVGMLTEEGMAEEAARYGDAGINPQVIWANGTLASTAVGIIIDLVTDWTRSLRQTVYLSYDGNRGIIQEHPKLAYSPRKCVHYSHQSLGEPTFAPIGR